MVHAHPSWPSRAISLTVAVLVTLTNGPLPIDRVGAQADTPPALAVGAPSASASSVPLYEKFEATFSLQGTVATSLQFPYDAVAPAGLAGRTGVSVEGLFLPPGQMDWGQAIRQPAFLYQDYQRQQIEGKDWLAAVGEPVWKVRFAPGSQGTWQYLIRAQDAALCPAGVSPCTSWVQTAPASFAATAPNVSNHGYVRVSPNDRRYFAFDDGTPFIGQGINDSFTDDTYGADSRLATYGANGLTLVRAWMSNSTVAGSAWSPWDLVGSDYYGYIPDPGLVSSPNEPGHDFVFGLNAATGRTCIFNGWTRGHIPVKRSTTYRISASVKAFNMRAADATKPYGFTLKTGDWPSDCPANLARQPNLVPYAANTDGWTTVSGTLATTTDQDFLNYLYMEIENLSAGEAYISEVSLREVQADGSLGPEVLVKSKSDAHLDFNQQASFAWDHIVDEAKQDGVYLKLVVLEKNDRVWNEIKPDGTPTSTDDNNNFYAAANTKVRRLHEYYWRYLAARWGYSTAIHSWELLNEGDPYNGKHYAQADSFAQEMHQAEPSRHLVTTSTWAAFPVGQFWGNPQYANIDYADVHAYVSTGFGARAWNPPSSTALETDPSQTYEHSAGALRLVAGVTSDRQAIQIRGMGTWTIQAMTRAEGLVGTCPYGAPPAMAGPQIEIIVSDGPTRVIPNDPSDPDRYWTCTAPAGTYGYTPVQGTFPLTDTGWHTLTVDFKTSYATSGTVWYDNLVIQAPDGRTARLFGDGTFDDYDRNDYDTGLFNAVYGLLDGAQSVSGAGKPLIRGETGIDYPGGPQQEQADIVRDERGVWLHNLVWGALNPGGMLDLYWWTTSIQQNNLYFQYKPVRDFLASIPFANGLYQDARPLVSSSNVHATGQTDHQNGRGYLWLWNKNHSWYNVVHDIAWGTLSGSLGVPGLTPSAAYSTQLWEFDTDGNLTHVTTTLTADPRGVLQLDLSTLPSSVTDLALQFAPA